MKIAIRKEPNGSIYFDKDICQRMVKNENGEEVRLFNDDTLTKEPYNYSFVEINDKYVDIDASDFNDDLSFNENRYISKNRIKECNKIITELKVLLVKSDYICLKWCEDEISDIEYEYTKTKRKEYRLKINQLEQEIDQLKRTS